MLASSLTSVTKLCTVISIPAYFFFEWQWKLWFTMKEIILSKNKMYDPDLVVI